MQLTPPLAKQCQLTVGRHVFGVQLPLKRQAQASRVDAIVTDACRKGGQEANEHRRECTARDGQCGWGGSFCTSTIADAQHSLLLAGAAVCPSNPKTAQARTDAECLARTRPVGDVDLLCPGREGRGGSIVQEPGWAEGGGRCRCQLGNTTAGCAAR